MNLLSLGARMPKNWGAPRSLYNYSTGRHDSGGMVWYGPSEATEADRQALHERFTKGVKIDERSTVGTRHPDYTTFYKQNRGEKRYNQRIILGFRF